LHPAKLVAAPEAFYPARSDSLETARMLNTCPTADHPLWIDLFNPTDEESARVQSGWHMRVPSRAELEEIESSSRLYAENGTIYLSMPVIAHEGEPGPTPLGFVLSRNILITIRYTQLHGFDIAVQRFREDGAAKTSAEVFAMLIEGMVDYAADALEHIGLELNAVSKRVFRSYGSIRQRNIARSNRALREILVRVGGSGEKVSQIRESLLGLQRILPFMLDKAKDWIDREIVDRIHTAIQDLQSLSDFELHLSNKIQFLLDAVLGFINTEQNDIFKVLTIVSVVGIPPTLIASMYGMNFHNMPELSWPWGYEWGLLLIFMSIVLPVAWFKWRGWW
jgi:magnesium transporter